MPAIVPKRREQAMQEFHELIASLTRDWFRLQCANTVGRVYLIGTKGRDSHGCEIWTSLRAGWEPVGDEKRIREEPINSGYNTEQAADRIRQWLNREPLYVFAD